MKEPIKKTVTSSVSLFCRTKKGKCSICIFRILWIIAIISNVIIFHTLTEESMSLTSVEQTTYTSDDNAYLKKDELFQRHHNNFLIGNIVCGAVLIATCLINILSNLKLKIGRSLLKKHQSKLMLINFNIQLLFIFCYIILTSEHLNFFCKLDNYEYWFEHYTNATTRNLFFDRGKTICNTYKYAFVPFAVFFIFSLIEYLIMYALVQKSFRRKFWIFYLKTLAGTIFLSLFCYYLSNKYFFHNVISKRNVINYEEFEESAQIIIFSSNKQKQYYLNLLIAANGICAIFLLGTAYYDLATIVTCSKFFMLINVVMSICFIIIIFSKILFSTYLLSTRNFFCSYKEYFTMNMKGKQTNNYSNNNKRTLLTFPPQSDITETLWFCNMNSFFYTYFITALLSFLIYVADLVISLQMTFSEKFF